MNRFFLLSCSLLALTSCDEGTIPSTWFSAWADVKQFFYERVMPAPSDELSNYMPQDLIRPEQTVTGSYLASRFAQNNGDWQSAGKFVNNILDDAPANVDFRRKAMILAMGAGRYNDALHSAKLLAVARDQGSLAYLLLSLESFKDGDVEKTMAQLRGIPQDGIGEFITPLITGWTFALKKETNIAGLTNNPVHLFHAVLIADFLNDRAALVGLTKHDFTGMGLAPDLLVQLETIFIKHDLKVDARKIREKLAGYEMGQNTERLTAVPITTAREGLAQALYDMGSMLYSVYGDSARLFAHMALYLNPAHIDARILLAQMASDVGRVDESISLYQKINTNGKAELAVKVERQIAELLEKNNKPDAAIRVLKKLVSETKNIEAQIQIGDIYRRLDDFSNALKEYNIAASMVGEPIPETHWELLYARGMTYERLKKWDKAEADLKAALSYEPDHPYILNYLGYSWADQGINLSKAAEMIERAVQLQPQDGYIVDSLGWVYFRMKDYGRAVKYLERAVELMPYDPTINDHLGDAYWRLNRHNEARFQWRRALSFKPEPDQKILIEQKIERGLDDTQSSLPLPTAVSNTP